MLILTQDNYLDYAKENYLGLRVVNSDNFTTLLRSFNRIEKIINNNNIPKYRMLLNYIVILNNSFGTEAANRLLFFLIAEKNYSTIKTCIHYLGGEAYDIPEADVSQINIDSSLLHTLENL